VPTDGEIKSKLPLAGYKNISISEKDNEIKLLKEGIIIDFSI
jgi:thiamine biosynthesis lipoprotein ApbE